MTTADVIRDALQALGLPVSPGGPGTWTLDLQSAGLDLVVELTDHGRFLRAVAAVLPPGLIAPRQLLRWNAQAPLVCFAENATGEVIVCGELPVRGLDAEGLDQFLGLVHALATRAREFVL